jgi:hypothetical protein
MRWQLQAIERYDKYTPLVPQVELLCAVSDVCRLWRWDRKAAAVAWRLWLAGLPALLAAALLGMVAADMHFTARHFHERLETGVALLAGAALIQVPLLLWVRKARAQRPTNPTD